MRDKLLVLLLLLPILLRAATIYVTTDQDGAQEGTLRYALAQSGERDIKFTFSGTIVLESELIITEPYFNVIGESSTTPGVQITGASIIIRTHDWKLSHLSIRRSDANFDNGGDAVSLSTGCYNGWVDHCSILWGLDENLGINGANDIRVTNCIIGEALNCTGYSGSETCHSKGALIYYNAKNIDIYGNLFINNRDRNPLFQAGFEGNFINNVSYNGYQPPNCAKSAMVGTGEPLFHVINIIGNTSYGFREGYGFRFNSVSDDCQVYMNDNNYTSYWGSVPDLSDQPVYDITVDVMTRETAEAYVIYNAGAFYWDRCLTDQRLIDFYINKEAGLVFDDDNEIGIIDSPSEVGYNVFEFSQVLIESDALDITQIDTTSGVVVWDFTVPVTLEDIDNYIESCTDSVEVIHYEFVKPSLSGFSEWMKNR